MTVMQKKTDSPIAHLTSEDVETLGVELDAIRQSIIDSRGAGDAAYIRKVIDAQRKLELGSRALLLASLFPPAWVVGLLLHDGHGVSPSCGRVLSGRCRRRRPPR